MLILLLLLLLFITILNELINLQSNLGHIVDFVVVMVDHNSQPPFSIFSTLAMLLSHRRQPLIVNLPSGRKLFLMNDDSCWWLVNDCYWLVIVNRLEIISGLLVCRIEEEILWESKQLGAHSPHVLLNTLVSRYRCRIILLSSSHFLLIFILFSSLAISPSSHSHLHFI